MSVGSEDESMSVGSEDEISVGLECYVENIREYVLYFWYLLFLNISLSTFCMSFLV